MEGKSPWGLAGIYASGIIITANLGCLEGRRTMFYAWYRCVANRARSSLTVYAARRQRGRPSWGNANPRKVRESGLYMRCLMSDCIQSMYSGFTAARGGLLKDLVRKTSIKRREAGQVAGAKPDRRQRLHLSKCAANDRCGLFKFRCLPLGARCVREGRVSQK